MVFVVLPTEFPRQPLCSGSSLWDASRCGAQVLVSLASAAVAAGGIPPQRWLLALIHIEEFSRDCFAWRQRATSLIVSQNALVRRQAEGSALDVLNEVLSWEPGQ